MKLKLSNNKNDIDIREKYNIRISKPYGYYQEDVNKIILDFMDKLDKAEEKVKTLELENKDIKEKYEKTKAEFKRLQLEMAMGGEESSPKMKDSGERGEDLDIAF